MGGADWQRTTGQGAGRGRRDRRRSSSSCTGAALATPGHAFPPDTPWQREIEARLPLHRDRRPAAGDRRREGGHGAPRADGPPRLRRRRLRQDRGGDPRGLQGVQDGKQAAVLVPTTLLAQPALPDVLGPLRGLSRCASRCCSRFLTAAEAATVVAGLADGSVDVVIGTHRLLARGRRVQGPRAARRRRGAALRRHAQGGGEAARRRASTC